MKMLNFGITDHVEGPRGQPSREVFEQIIRQSELADRLGFEYAWFAEHHAHAHFGHLPAPNLLALHLAGRTTQIRLGSAVVCLNLHHPLAVAEQCATADILMNGRGAFGFGSGSTPEEFSYFGMAVTEEAERHARFEQALRLMQAAWLGDVDEAVGRPLNVPPHKPLPIAAPDLAGRSWLAVNSLGAAKVAGALNFNMLFSHLRTPEQYRQYTAAYRQASGGGKIAANRPVHVARDDATAWERIEPALRILWRRFRAEGKIPGDMPEPRRAEDLCRHPINFIVGGPKTVAGALMQLREQSPYDVANLEVRWEGLAEPDIHDCMQRLAEARGLMGDG
ncbi:MAG TPA: LLM class flavin-dependent oxidoreductase [Tepidisphaeraceae bacterium]|jgi:alkanesulfonate monooxygenase SsuD/methylene tetrahydromethanopterin reductase-like flavin-dependent oxidoreductase (luciferase family)|nr:LLM class flavin-dependent oxidoreductase [Tepidisphaeraceae bacterium]